MRKLVNKLKGNKGGKATANNVRPHPDGGGLQVVQDEELANSKFGVLNPTPQPPRPPPDHGTTIGKNIAGQDDVGTFSGFGTWMASFEPDPTARGVAEISAQSVEEIPHVHDMLSMDGDWPTEYMIRLTLTGIRKPEAPGSPFAVTIIGPWFMRLAKVNELLAQYGYEKIVSAKHGSRAVSNWSADEALPTELEIPVVDGVSHYDFDSAGHGLLIGRDEQVGNFLKELRQLRVRCRDDKVVVTSFPAELEIGFNRTLRLPEDGKVHNQSVRLGSIPVTNIAGIAKKLESSRNQSLMDMARKGGVFFPLYQREAMFLSFKAKQDAFAVRVFVGGINAVSGLPWNQRASATQDYLSVPPQHYLDGVSVGRDVVRQFIAMPLGSGYSVEKQVTGKETVGGMQLEIIPGNGWVVQVPASPNMPQEGPYTPGYSDTPRMTGVSIMILSKKTSIGQHMDDKLAEDERLATESRPVLMHHLYRSQLLQSHSQYRQFGYGQSSNEDGFCGGAAVQMKAVYMLNLKLSYWDTADGMYRIKEVQWAPWWTIAECFDELGKVNFTLNGRSITEFTLYRGAQLHAGRGTLEEQGIRDGDTITAQTPAPQPQQQHYQQGLNYHAGSHNANWFPDQDSTSPYQYEQHNQQQTPYPGNDYVAHEMPSNYAPYESQPGTISSPQSYSYSPGASPYSHTQQSYSPNQQSQPSPQPGYIPPSQSHASPPYHYGQTAPVRPAYPPQLSGAPSRDSPPPPAAFQAPVPYPDSMPSPGAASLGSTSYTPADNRPSAPSKSGSRWSFFSSSSSPAPVPFAAPSSATAASPSSTAPTSYLPQSPSPPSTMQGSSGYESPPPRFTAPQQVAPIQPPRAEKRQDQTGWAMGIAAGTRIRQAIHRDSFSASHWAKHRATIISVQILNSVAFEALTGMMAPMSPITAQMYIDQGLPFFSSYDEGITTDGQKNLASIKSVGDIDAMDGAISLGANAAGASKVGCTCCGRMLCDSIIRPCNHAFCSPCIANYMTHGPAVYCRICNTKATRLIGFSAPMALPGEDRLDLSIAKVITTQPYQGAQEFQSIYELGDGKPVSGVTYELAEG